MAPVSFSPAFTPPPPVPSRRRLLCRPDPSRLLVPADGRPFQGQGRTTRQRVASDENNENSSTHIMTRAKAAALGVEEPGAGIPAKSALQPKKSAVNASNAGVQRRRAALGDVSNVGKADVADDCA